MVAVLAGVTTRVFIAMSHFSFHFHHWYCLGFFHGCGFGPGDSVLYDDDDDDDGELRFHSQHPVCSLDRKHLRCAVSIHSAVHEVVLLSRILLTWLAIVHKSEHTPHVFVNI